MLKHPRPLSSISRARTALPAPHHDRGGVNLARFLSQAHVRNYPTGAANVSPT